MTIDDCRLTIGEGGGCGRRRGAVRIPGMADRIVLFGGSFDPVHHGHLIVARAIAERYLASVRSLRDSVARGLPNFVSQAEAFWSTCHAEAARLDGRTDPQLWATAAGAIARTTAASRLMVILFIGFSNGCGCKIHFLTRGMVLL